MRLDPDREEATWRAITARPFLVPRSDPIARTIRRLTLEHAPSSPEFRHWRADFDADRDRSLEALVATLDSAYECDDWEVDCE